VNGSVSLRVRGGTEPIARTVAATEIDVRTVTITVTIAASPEVVWRAVLDQVEMPVD
jgi:hypothetical protein